MKNRSACPASAGGWGWVGFVGSPPGRGGEWVG